MCGGGGSRRPFPKKPLSDMGFHVDFTYSFLCMGGGKFSKIERTNFYINILKNVFGKYNKQKVSDYFEVKLNLGSQPALDRK